MAKCFPQRAKLPLVGNIDLSAHLNDGHLSGLQFSATVNEATVNIQVQV